MARPTTRRQGRARGREAGFLRIVSRHDQSVERWLALWSRSDACGRDRGAIENTWHGARRALLSLLMMAPLLTARHSHAPCLALSKRSAKTRRNEAGEWVP